MSRIRHFYNASYNDHRTAVGRHNAKPQRGALATGTQSSAAEQLVQWLQQDGGSASASGPARTTPALSPATAVKASVIALLLSGDAAAAQGAHVAFNQIEVAGATRWEGRELSATRPPTRRRSTLENAMTQPPAVSGGIRLTGCPQSNWGLPLRAGEVSQTLVFDTGSDDLVLMGQGCATCDKTLRDVCSGANRNVVKPGGASRLRFRLVDRPDME